MKPHKGCIANARRVDYADGYIYRCYFRDHPEFAGTFGHTSKVIKEEGAEIETLNTRYTICDLP